MNREIASTDRPVDRLARSGVLDRIADVVQPQIRALLDGTGPLAPIKDLLHGTTLRHPLHPALTDVPIGAWTMTAVFDAVATTGNDRFEAAADLSLGLGIAGALAAVATGYAEWSDTSGEPKRLGMAHALTNAAALGLYLWSAGARRSGARGVGIATAFAGYGLVSAGAYLGGELSQGYGIGSKHTTVPLEPPDDFSAVLPERELLVNHPQRVELGGIPVLLSRDAAGIHAVSAVCTHRGAPLEQGTFADGCVTCPWHGARFRLADGGILEGPAVYPLARFETRERDGSIELRAIR